ncbi:MAG: hypothetical protein U0939_16880 [Pirellulales bacterium]
MFPLEPSSPLEPSASPAPADRSAPRAPPPVAPLTATQRRELQRRFERAWQMMQQSPSASLEAHHELAACVAADPASALYADALLLNLRKPAHGNKKSFWLGRWARQSRIVAAALRGDWSTILSQAPALLIDDPRHLPLLLALVDAHQASGHREAAWRYTEEALQWADSDVEVRRRAARVRMTRGQFSAARLDWLFVAQTHPADLEAAHYLPLLPDERSETGGAERTTFLEAPSFVDELAHLRTLCDARRWSAAETRLSAARARHGSRLELREFSDELALARHLDQQTIAQRLADAERLRPQAPSPLAAIWGGLWQGLADELSDSILRLEVEILAGRCRLYPTDPALHAQLGERLQRLQNWPEAARCWEVAAESPDASQAAAALLHLGETRQRLRQFGPALACYRASLARSSEGASGTGEMGTGATRRRTLEHARRLARALGREEEAASYERQLSEARNASVENPESTAEGP